MDRDEIAAKELKRRKDFSLSASIVPSLNFQPSTINSGDQSEVSNSSSVIVHRLCPGGSERSSPPEPPTKSSTRTCRTGRDKILFNHG